MQDAGAVAVNTITAATLSQNVKAKDEITLEIKLMKDGAQTLHLPNDGGGSILAQIEQTHQEFSNGF